MTKITGKVKKHRKNCSYMWLITTICTECKQLNYANTKKLNQ